jgi:ABC-2 type transport system permease protein
MRSRVGRIARAEWTKLRSVPSTWWTVAAAVGTTVGLGLLVCSAVDTSGGGPSCTPGAPGCGDEDVVMNSLAGAYAGQIAFVALGVLASTSEYATGMIRTTFLANPGRRSVLLSKAAVVAGVALAVGLAAAAASFLLGQPVLHGNGFVPAQGYPFASISDGAAIRAVAGTGLYLATMALLGLGVGMVVRRSAAAISVALGLLFVPFMVAIMLPTDVWRVVQRVAPMTAGLAIQRTVERSDSVPIGEWAGLGVAAAWAAITLGAALWLVRRRDA